MRREVEMENIYPGVKILKIDDGGVLCEKPNGLKMSFDKKFLPQDTKVGDKVVVTTETTVKKVEKQEIKEVGKKYEGASDGDKSGSTGGR